MKIILNLQKYQREKLFSHITNVRDMMKVCLDALEYLQYWQGNPKAEKRPFMIVDLDDTHRIYLVDKDKIISFSFLLNIKLDGCDLSDTTNSVSGVFLKKHKITAREISEAKQILTNCAEPESLYCYNVLEEDTDLSIESIYLFEHLLFLEWGYLRFDHDPSSAIPGLHPTNHFDVNFNPMCSYKLGVDRQLEVTTIIDMVNKHTVCANVVF